MPEPIDDALAKVIKDVLDSSDLTETSTAVKNLKTIAEAKNLIDPDPIPDPEPTGFKAFLERHSGDLIKVGGTLVVVSIIAVIETKGDVIFRSKASKFI